ncbi:asparagine synthase (plasmid) [Streptomyces nigrescens]|uniref:Asparagine synthase n=1 Tax=Streptomyces nigrescens TaxID=1920 RepID=A0ABN6RAF7_STRNI|nr:asparagine synthase-related protein [Streptomyces nigrescens]BDM74926.1 asparagine synthase [Streptomyces nigrescens]
MSDPWISGGGLATPPWSEGEQVDGIPGVRLGPGVQARVLTNERASLALVGDVSLAGEEEPKLLDAVAGGRWAELTYLPGSYWVLAQNGTHRFVCGDLSGLRSVFYTMHGPHTLWSTSARRLATHCAAPPDLAMLAARLTAGAEHWPKRTAYEGVYAVPGGFGLLLGGPQPELVDVSGIEPLATLAEGAPVFGAALKRAVHWRMQEASGRAGADVSGGLDSSSVAILAARVGEVRAVTYADAFTSAEDLTFARRVAQHMDAPLHVGTGGRAHLPFAWQPNQPVTDQPAAMSLTTAQQQLYLRPAAGLPLHFTGNGGDVVLDSCSAAWIGMVQCGDRRAARRQVTGWARARNRSPRELWQAVTRAAEIGHAGALQDAAGRMARGDFEARRPGVWSWCHLGQSATWLTPFGRERVAALLRGAADSADKAARADLAEQHLSLRLVGADARDTAPLAAAWGVRQVHPFIDNQVVRAAFAISPIERHGVTTFKPLLAAALPSLPTWLTSRRSKGSFSRQLTAGMLHNQAALAHLIRTSPLVTSGLLDPEPALAALAGIGGAHAGALYDLQRLTMTSQWLATSSHSTKLELEEAC